MYASIVVGLAFYLKEDTVFNFYHNKIIFTMVGIVPIRWPLILSEFISIHRSAIVDGQIPYYVLTNMQLLIIQKQQSTNQTRFVGTMEIYYIA